MSLWTCLIGVLTLSVAGAISEECSRPISGTYIKDNWRSGSGELTVDNGQNLDAVAVLKYPNGHVYLANYIRSGESATLAGIQDGAYNVYLTLGKNWDCEACKFTINPVYFRLGKDASFNTDWKDTGHYTKATLSLNAGIGEHALNQVLNENEFPNLK